MGDNVCHNVQVNISKILLGIKLATKLVINQPQMLLQLKLIVNMVTYTVVDNEVKNLQKG